jgi:hypothetical protein
MVVVPNWTTLISFKLKNLFIIFKLLYPTMEEVDNKQLDVHKKLQFYSSPYPLTRRDVIRSWKD